jgi:hypothetical protein
MCYVVSDRGGRVDLNIEEVTCDQVLYDWNVALGYIPVNYNVETSKLHLMVSNIQLG